MAQLLHVQATERFLKAYEKESFSLQMLIDGAVHDFERRFTSDPRNCVRRYDRVERSKQDLLEIDVCGGKRMVAHWKPSVLTLVDVGAHAVVDRARKLDVQSALRQARPAPPHFLLKSRSVFLRLPAQGFQQYANELAPDWIYHLDAEQTEVQEASLASTVEVLDSDDSYALHVVIGGPGTGKTSILVSVLKWLSDLGDYAIHLGISDDLRVHLEQCLPVDLAPFTTTEIEDADIVLLDDPDYMWDMGAAAERGRTGRARLIVVAVDPVQLGVAVTDDEFAALLQKYGALRHELHTCYRQKENVGEATKRVMEVIAESTPFLDSGKVTKHHEEHAELTSLSNALRFPNPIGYANVYPAARQANVQAELHRIANQPGGLWTHTLPLLVAVIDEPSSAPPKWFVKQLDGSRIPYRLIEPANMRSIKGLEFQHAFVLASKQLLAELDEGFSGTGRRLYDTRRLLRIPFSRAKDSIVTFGIG